MKKTACITSLLIGIFLLQSLLAPAQIKKIAATNKVKEHLLSLEYKWLKAEFALDTTYLSSIMDPTYIGISENGIHNKQQDLLGMYNNISQRIKDGVVVDSFRLENEMVQLYGNAAVITLIVHTYRKDKNIPTQRRTRFYDVWVNKKGKWLAVSSQGTPVAE